ncbi:MAG: c-type cytochrome [Burkholderiales bacterium]|nr:c-type cytochrome [Burkholderiales bacterium]
MIRIDSRIRRAALACAAVSTIAGTAAAEGPLSRYTPPADPALAERIAAADLAAGERSFDRRCATCHDAVKTGAHSKGPHLWNVVGRKAGSAPGFAYSDAMKNSGHTWTLAALDYFLADTERAVPRRAMDFTGLADANARAALIAYLRTMSDSPVPLR